MHRVPRAWVVVSVLVLVLGSCARSGVEEAATTTSATPVTSTTAVASTTTTTGPAELLVWVPCGSVECATLTVPLDHEDPSEGMIDLAVARRRATRPEERIGVLLFNPGGPDIPGTPYVMDWTHSLFSSELLRRFDVVSWDVRGVSEGTRVDCGDDLEHLVLVDTARDTPEEEALVQERAREIAAGCVERSGDLLPYLSTLSTARDMEALRHALGEEQISYLGVSWGTALGSIYATLFPERVRAMVLDAALDLSAPYADLTVQRAAAEERALTLALEGCATSSECPFHNDGDPFTAFDDLMTRLDVEPLIVDDTEVGLGHALSAVGSGLTSEVFWPTLMRALARAQDGDGSQIRDLALGPPGIREDFESLYSIVCLDWPRSAMDPSETLVDGLLTVAPRLGPYYLLWEEIGPCSVWPSEPDPPPPLTGNGAGPILVIGTTGDILTPLEASRDLAAHLQQGVLLIVEANHHGAYHGLRDDARCVAQTVDRYLTSLEIPPNQSKCQPGDTQPQPPD